MTFARKQDNGAVKSLNAKKLDIDFGNDDFFNSFAAKEEEPAPMFGSSTAAPKKSNKLQEVGTDSLWGGPVTSMGSSNSYNIGGGDSY